MKNEVKKRIRVMSAVICTCLLVSLCPVQAQASSVPSSVVIITTIISNAESRLGCQYVWGSRGPDTFDCSGLAYYCYKLAGVTISKTNAYSQKKGLQENGCLVANNNKQVSYLIFYNVGTNAPTLGIGHVSIYMGSHLGVLSIIEAEGANVHWSAASAYSSDKVVAVCRPCNWFYTA